MYQIPESELILNPDGSIYHLHLRPEDISPTIITVGDPDRVGAVSKYFDKIILKKQKREFHTHTGILGGKRLMVISTGIGTDNIDIVLNELDALVNIDFLTRTIKPKFTSLNIVRIGTSGSLQADLPIDSFLVSSAGIGLDGLMNVYQMSNNETEKGIKQHFCKHINNKNNIYVAEASNLLVQKLGNGIPKGITLTCGGFYGAQGRQLRLKTTNPDFIQNVNQFRYDEEKITNFEMETAGIYGLSKVLGHRAISFNAILANRITQKFSQQPKRKIDELIRLVLERLVKIL